MVNWRRSKTDRRSKTERRGKRGEEARTPQQPAEGERGAPASAPSIARETEPVKGQCPLRLLASAIEGENHINLTCAGERCSWWLEMGGCALVAMGEGALAIAEVLAR